MNRRLDSLKLAVENLAAPASQQIAYLGSLGDNIGPEELALQFEDVFPFVRSLCRDGAITDNQHEAILAVSHKLDAFRRQADAEHWQLAMLEKSPYWQELRGLAAAFLNSTTA